MRPPIRVVCEGCLRSVELGSDSSPEPALPCPYCGRLVDSQLGPVTSEQPETRVRTRPADSDTTDATETIDWATAWTRGTLGSLGRFQLRERLGDGGFGQVYLAYDPRLDRDVAVKVLKQPDPSGRVMERFFREARAVARLDHPNIVPVHDAGFDDGTCWVAYQLVGGRPLWWYRDRQRMDPFTAATIVRDLADALGHAHSLGVVHRDIKPGNVMIDDRGRARLIDFGLARRSDVDSDLTRDGVVVGTPAYMSPEQARGQSKQADERSDVYSLGVIFYELLCGRRPGDFRNEGVGVPVESADKAAPPPGARTLNPSVPRALDAICARAMSRDPADRYPSARAFMDAIDAWLDGAGRRRGRPVLSPRTLLWGLGAASVLALVLACVRVPGSKVERVASAPEDRPAHRDEAVVPGAVARIPSTPVDPMSLVGNPDKHKYHLYKCATIRNSDLTKFEMLASHEEAKDRGYTKCSKCQ